MSRHLTRFRYGGAFAVVLGLALLASTACRQQEPIATDPAADAPTLNPPANELAPADPNLDPDPFEAEPAASGQPSAPSAEAEAAEIRQALAHLSPEDLELAVEQRVCPVTGALLGSMGTPRKIRVEGHDVFICCEGCEEEIRDNATSYLAKLGLEPVRESIDELTTELDETPLDGPAPEPDGESLEE